MSRLEGLKGQLAICQGDAGGGIPNVQHSLEKLHSARYGLLTTEFSISLAQGLAATGRCAEGMALIEETMQRVEADGDLIYLPELLRVKSGLLLLLQAGGDNAQTCLIRSLELSRRQGARAWELRAAVDLAALLARQRRRKSARTLLRLVFEQFVEGLETSDLKAAERLLAILDSASQPISQPMNMTPCDNE